jgi:hypothetical protein
MHGTSSAESSPLDISKLRPGFYLVKISDKRTGTESLSSFIKG